MARAFKSYTDGRYVYEINEVVPNTWYIAAYYIVAKRKGSVCKTLGRVDAKCIKREHWASKYTAQDILERAALEKGWKEWVA